MSPLAARAALVSTVVVLLANVGARGEELSFDCVAEPAQTVRLGSPVTGLLDALLVERGDIVRAGDMVARLDSAVEQANVALADAQANSTTALEAQRTRLELAQTALARAEQLLGSGGVTQSRIEELAATVEIAALDLSTEMRRLEIAGLELGRQRALLDRLVIRSPIEGVVSSIDTRVGEFVRQDSVVMTIVQTNPLQVDAYLPTTLWNRLEVGEEGEVLLDLPVEARHPARIAIIDSVFDVASATFGIRLQLENPGNLIPAGQRCTLALTAD